MMKLKKLLKILRSVIKMKNVKRLLSALLVLALFMCSMSISVSADTEDISDKSNIYFTANDITILFPEDPSDYFCEHVLLNLTAESESSDATDGLLCTLFGHKYETSTAITVTHRVRPVAPRCLKNTYQYNVCTRCGYTQSTLLSSQYIYCCR